MTVLYTPHYMEEAAELSHRVGIIDHGQMIALGTQKELTRQVGETETLILHLEEGQDPAPLVAVLRSIPGVLRVDVGDKVGDEVGDTRVTLIATEAKEILPPAIVRAGELGFKVRTIDIREPNLEAVFLHLTGRALRD